MSLPDTECRSFRGSCFSRRSRSPTGSRGWPLPAGADLYLLKSVLSDWPDRDARAILTRCADAARPTGRVVLLNGGFTFVDGGNILQPWLSPPYQRAYNLFAPYGFILLFVLLWQSEINQVFFGFVYWIGEAIGVPAPLAGEGFQLMRFWQDWL